jgi:uncharacterized protein (DUF1778 family)
MIQNARLRNTTLTVRLTEEEKQAIIAKAHSRSQNLTEYLVSALLLESSEERHRHILFMKQLKSISDKLASIAIMIKEQGIKSTEFQGIVDMQNELKEQVINMATHNRRE